MGVKLGVSPRRLKGRIFGGKRDEMAEEWRQIHK
jgi:hypothetical protein